MCKAIEYALLKIRYKELLAKSERQRKQIAMLEQSRRDMRKAFAHKVEPHNIDYLYEHWIQP